MTFEEERERIKLHRQKTIELLGSEEFPIYKVAIPYFKNRDLEPQCLFGHKIGGQKCFHGIPSTEPMQIINQKLTEGWGLLDIVEV